MHANLALPRRGQQAHDRRLNDGDQRHITVSGHRNRRQQFGRQRIGKKDRSRTIRPADNPNRTGGLITKTEQLRADKGTEDTELRRTTE